jgi:hypothetical protein
VAVLPASALSGLPGGSGSAASAGKAASSAAQAASGSGSGGSGDNSALFGAVLRSGKHVHGTWGSGQLLHTSLISVLVTSDGRVLVGAVTPSVLYADAAPGK